MTILMAIRFLSVFLLNISVFHLYPIASQCVYDNLDLSSIYNHQIICPTADGHSFQFSACGREEYCFGPNYMAVYYDDNNNLCNFALAEFDDWVIAPEYSSANGGRWSLVYTDSYSPDCLTDDGILDFHLIYVCDKDAALFPSSKCQVVDGCTYELEVFTKFACATPSWIQTTDQGLSGGSIFLIVFFSGFFLYCAVGYLFYGYKSKDWTNFNRNIPQLRYWIVLIKLTRAGCVYSKDYILSLCSGQTV